MVLNDGDDRPIDRGDAINFNNSRNEEKPISFNLYAAVAVGKKIKRLIKGIYACNNGRVASADLSVAQMCRD